MQNKTKEEYDSDSAPEDIAFEDSKNQALEEIKAASDAVKNKKKTQKERNKRRHEALVEQKQIRDQRLKDLESKKLPDFVLDAIEDKNDEEQQPAKKVVLENKITTFEDEGFEITSDNEEKSSEDFIALETDATKFKVMTSKDLKNSSSHNASAAFNFRENMLFGKRVRREPYSNQKLKAEKIKAGGRSSKVHS